MHEEALFKALSTENKIPWEKSAEHFMYMKLASGGLLGDEVDLLIKTAEGTIAPEDIQRAMDQGTLSGVRSSVAQDITNHAKHQRTHGERLGKGVGTMAGIGAGLLAGRGKGLTGQGHSIGEKAFRAAAGMALGHEAGKVVGQELDAHKLNKRGAMEKGAGDLTEKNSHKVAGVLGQIGGWAIKHPTLAAGAAGAGVGAIGGAVSNMNNPQGSMLGGALKGGLAGGGLGIAGAHFGMKAMAKGGRSAALNIPGKGTLNLAPKLTGEGRLAEGALSFNPASPKVASALALIKEGWSLRNLFRSVPEMVPPEDVGEAAVSGGLQDGAAGAINEAAGQAGVLAGHAIGERFHAPVLGGMAGNLGAKGLSGQLTEGMESPKTAAATKLLSAIRSLKKTAEDGRDGLSTTDEHSMPGANEASGNQYPAGHDEMGAAPDAEPVATVDPDLQPDPSDAIMALLQKGNESEFHEARADEAQQAASAAEERAGMLEGQMQQLLQEIEQVKQDQGGQAQMASEQAQMSSQDAMSARTESQAAQQQVMMLRQSITSYRQQLMDLLAQDPTMAAGPPPVPVGPAPGPPGAEGGAAGPDGQPMPPGGGSQPQEMPAEATGAAPPAPAAPAGGEAPEAPKPPSAEGGGGAGVNVNIHPPKAAKPAAKA
jgi:hypothetical protein